MSIGEKGALVEVNLEEGKSNAFEVILSDANGNRLECAPPQITIIQVDEVEGAPLPNSLGIGIGDEGNEVFETLKGAKKGSLLPVAGVYTGLRTPRDIRPGVFADSFSVRLYEGGSDAQGSPVLANDFLCELKITGKDVKQFIPGGSRVDLTVETGPDSSLPVRVTLFFPALDEEIELDVPSMVKAPNAEALLYRIFYEGDRLVSRMRKGGVVDFARLSELEDRLDEIKDLFDVSNGDRGALDQTLHRLREVYRELSRLSR